MEPARCCFIPDRPAGHINGPSYRLKNRLAAVDTTDVPPPELPRIPERRLTRRTFSHIHGTGGAHTARRGERRRTCLARPIPHRGWEPVAFRQKA
jgi:hypothetical protein